MTATDASRQLAAAEACDFRPIAQTETHSISIGDAPDVPNRYGSGMVSPVEVDIVYTRGEDGTRSITARIEGMWRHPDGHITDAPLDQHYSNGPDETWPDWLAGLAWYYHPEPHLIPKATP